MKRRSFLKNTSLLATAGMFYPKNIISFKEKDKSSTCSLWDLFGTDYRQNCRAWVHHVAENPVIPANGNGWKKYWTANPDSITFKGKKLLYYRGNGITQTDHTRHDRIAVAEIINISEDKFKFKDLNNGKFVLDVGGEGSFDDRNILDPAAIVSGDKIFLYYSAIGCGPDSIGLAISEDGINFHKTGKVLTGRSPDVLLKEDKIYMIYQRDDGEGYQGFYLAYSMDGVAFMNVINDPVFQTENNSWDTYVTTARFHIEDNIYYLLYGGSPDMNDQPDYFGLARSNDLISWEKHPGNPIFGLASKGEEDGGAIWFPAIIETPAHYIMLYEGSRGRYSWDCSSQICSSSIKRKQQQL